MIEPSAPSIFLVFLAGIVTILKPCCLPLVPVIFSGSGGHRLRPLAIVSGLTLSFTTMGVLVSAFGATFGSFADTLCSIAILFIISMGAVLFDEDINQAYISISSSVVNFVRERVSFLGNIESVAPKEGLFGGLFLGMSLGILWIPCVGPILGAVLAYVAESSASAGNLLHGVILLLVYSLGVSVPMLTIAYSGDVVNLRG